MHITNTEGVWRLEYFEFPSDENLDEQNDRNYSDEESE
jgi:hypothetical protein